MRILSAALILTLAALPAPAEETAPASPEAEEGFSLIEEGAKILLRSLLDDVQPKMEEMQKGLSEALAQMQPALKELLLKIDDFRNYHPPVILPNGDIIIRRKSPAEIVNPGGQIDL